MEKYFSGMSDVEVIYMDEIDKFIKSANPDTIYLNVGINSDSNLETLVPEDKYLREYNVDRSKLVNETIAKSRLIKNELEQEVMRYATKVTCEGHIDVLRKVKPGMMERGV